MQTLHFQKAKPIWCTLPKNSYNQFVGFYTQIRIEEEQELTFAIAARSYYRLYINGKMAANGPARTAKGYCRIDKITKQVQGLVHIAIEVVALDKPGKYSNDCTLEPGILVAEVTDADQKVLTATGMASWSCDQLTYRRELVETMSHSRGIVEYYDLTPDYDAWRMREGREAVRVVDEEITFLLRRAPYATYGEIPMDNMLFVSDVTPQEAFQPDTYYEIARLLNPKWYEMIPKENQFQEELMKEKEQHFTGSMAAGSSVSGESHPYEIIPGEHAAAITFGIEQSEVGFIDLRIEVEEPCVLDVMNADCLSQEGRVEPNMYTVRYCLHPGSYHLTTFEPKLIRFVKLILRTTGRVRLNQPTIIDDTYPDTMATSFACNDGELNQIYQAARRTLRLNTLDIFMDCPQRERGGWLCDSQFTSQGAWQLFGDLSVEKDFIENFMLTDPKVLWHGFFPEVYPGNHRTPEEVGIMSWSFWLMTELYDYAMRSGDTLFIEECRNRVEHFVEGLLALRGESGLLENMTSLFVDWSISNKEFNLYPINIPNNCLAVCVLEKLSKLYGHPDWKQQADEMRLIINGLNQPGFLVSKGDGAVYQNGVLKRCGCQTESGIALELWSGFHLDDTGYIRTFVDTMGYAPKHRSNPNIGKSNLFIGLMIRFDVLRRLGEIDTLVREWKNLYLPEIREGAGTLYENYNEDNGCHGFNAATGAFMVNEVLGLVQLRNGTKQVKICPHPGELTWATGTARCKDGMVMVHWSADHTKHELHMTVTVPKGWSVDYEFPFELSGWNIVANGQSIH